MTKPIRKDIRAVSPVIAVILMVAITVVLAGVLYVWVTQLMDPPEDEPRHLIMTVEQGDGNQTSGCLFILTKGSGEKIKIAEYSIKISEAGKSPITLRWPEDGNSTYTLNSNGYDGDGDYWDATERMGFDAPPGLYGISDSEIIEVSIVHLESDSIIYKGKFTYHD